MTLSSDRRRAELAVIEAARQIEPHREDGAYFASMRPFPTGLLLNLTDAVRALDALPLEEPTKARAGGPLLTSQNAAAFINGPRAKSMAARILREIERQHGATTEELCFTLSGKHQTVSARIHELWRNGWLYVAGERDTTSGQKASIWQITREARAMLLTGRAAEITQEWEAMRDDRAPTS